MPVSESVIPTALIPTSTSDSLSPLHVITATKTTYPYNTSFPLLPLQTFAFLTPSDYVFHLHSPTTTKQSSPPSTIFSLHISSTPFNCHSSLILDVIAELVSKIKNKKINDLFPSSTNLR